MPLLLFCYFLSEHLGLIEINPFLGYFFFSIQCLLLSRGRSNSHSYKYLNIKYAQPSTKRHEDPRKGLQTAAK